MDNEAPISLIPAAFQKFAKTELPEQIARFQNIKLLQNFACFDMLL